MRPYPVNSPQAAARIVALAMLADGHLAPSEIRAIIRANGLGRLALAAAVWETIVAELCEDLMDNALLPEDAVCTIEPGMLAALMAEIQDPGLRRAVLDLCFAVVAADAHVAEEEVTVLTAASAAWGLHRPLPHPSAETEDA